MTSCIRDPTQFHEELKRLSLSYTRLNVVKHWNVCCEKCLQRQPSFTIVTELSFEDVQHAHGLSLQGSLNLAMNMLRGCENEEALSMISSLRNHVRYDSASTPVREFAAKLSDLYNMLIQMDNGSIIHISSIDSRVLAVNLQAFVVVHDKDARDIPLSARE